MVTLVLLLILGIFVTAQSILLARRIDTLEQQVAANGSSMEQLRRSNDSALEQLAEVKEQVAQVRQELAAKPAEQEKPRAKLSETDAFFRVTLSEEGSDFFCDLQDRGAPTYQLSGTDQKVVACVLDGEQLWQIKLSEEESGKGFNKGTSFCFSYDVDTERLGQYLSTQPTEFLWLYRSADGEKWTELNESNGVHIETVPESSKSTITIADSWLREKLYDDAYEIKCVLTRHSRDGGTLVIELALAKTRE